MIPNIRTILYATDLSKNSSYAFLYAADMAKKHNAKIIILHSIEPLRHIYYETNTFGLEEMYEKARGNEQKRDIEKIKNKIKDKLEEFCKKVETKLGCPCVELVSKTLIPVGFPLEEILKAADEEACDAIVLGTHGKGVLRQTFLGSVAGSVLERSRKPVFIIPLPAEEINIDWDHI